MIPLRNFTTETPMFFPIRSKPSSSGLTGLHMRLKTVEFYLACLLSLLSKLSGQLRCWKGRAYVEYVCVYMYIWDMWYIMFFIIYLHMYDTVWLYMHMCDCIDTYIYIYSDLKTLGHKFIIAAFLVDQKNGETILSGEHPRPIVLSVPPLFARRGFDLTIKGYIFDFNHGNLNKIAK